MSSAESLRASQDLADGEQSPAGVKLWASWNRRHEAAGPVAALLGEDEAVSGSVLAGEVKANIAGVGAATLPEARHAESVFSSADISYDDPPTYSDGTPAMIFLSGQETLPEDMREVLHDMVDPEPASRPTADEVLHQWRQLRLGQL
jgi:hypothetical protein